MNGNDAAVTTSIRASVSGLPALRDDAIARLYEHCFGRLWGFARSLGLTADMAEEVAQEAFLRLVRKVAAEQAPTDPTAWLFRTTYNLAMDVHRRARRSIVADISASMLDPETEERITLWREVDQLPERQRAVLYLRYRADLGFAAIASILGITEGGARTASSRAIKGLKERMR